MYRRTLLSLAPFAALLLSAAAPATKPGDELLAPRIRAHFDSVLVELASRDVNALSDVQRERRAQLTRTLRSYKDRGVFPHNYDFPGQAIPYFVDRQTGTLCAVAHLLQSTGRRDIVNRVARANNNVWVDELRGDAEFEHWLADNGLALAEAARIQVPYWEGPDEAPWVSPSKSVAPTIGNAAVAGVATLNLFTNRDGHGRLRNWAGVASGVANVAVGMAAVRNERQGSMMGFVNIGLGSLSAAYSTRAIFKRHEALAARRAAEKTRVAVAPVLPTSESGAGLSLSVRF